MFLCHSLTPAMNWSPWKIQKISSTYCISMIDLVVVDLLSLLSRWLMNRSTSSGPSGEPTTILSHCRWFLSRNLNGVSHITTVDSRCFLWSRSKRIDGGDGRPKSIQRVISVDLLIDTFVCGLSASFLLFCEQIQRNLWSRRNTCLVNFYWWCQRGVQRVRGCKNLPRKWLLWANGLFYAHSVGHPQPPEKLFLFLSEKWFVCFHELCFENFVGFFM